MDSSAADAAQDALAAMLDALIKAGVYGPFVTVRILTPDLLS